MDEVAIEGSLPTDAGRLLVIASGDAVLGSPEGTVRLAGGVVVGGCLEVRGPVVIEGTLHADSLRVDAPLDVIVAPTWREAPLAGSHGADSRGSRGVKMQDDRIAGRTLCTQYSLCERLAFL